MHREGREVRQVFHENGARAVTSTDALSGDIYLALFNLSDEPQTVEATLSDLGLKGRKQLTDLWTGETARTGKETVSALLQPHACALYRIRK